MLTRRAHLCRPSDDATDENVDHCVTTRSSQAARVKRSSMEGWTGTGGLVDRSGWPR